MVMILCAIFFFFFDLEGDLTSFKFEHFDWILQLTYVGNITKNHLLLVNFIKIATLKVLADGNYLYNAASMHFVGEL